MEADWINAYAALASAIGTWVASIVVLVSVYILQRQLRETGRTIESASIQGAYVVWVGIDQFFVQHPELRPFFYRAKPMDNSLDETLQRKVEAAAEMILDCMANVFHQFPNLGPEEREAYGNFLKDRYQTQPAFRQFVDEYERWYPNSFIGFLRSEIKWIINKAPVQKPSSEVLHLTGAA
jgi:hypothetical protein